MVKCLITEIREPYHSFYSTFDPRSRGSPGLFFRRRQGSPGLGLRALEKA